jgi:hypothetical protein
MSFVDRSSGKTERIDLFEEQGDFLARDGRLSLLVEARLQYFIGKTTKGVDCKALLLGRLEA